MILKCLIPKYVQKTFLKIAKYVSKYFGFINDKYKSVYYQYRTNNKFTISNYFILLIKSLVDLIFFIFQKFPGPLGIYLRQKFLNYLLKKLEKI